MRSSRSLIQFCWERFARFRRLDNSLDCAWTSEVRVSNSADLAVYFSCSLSFCPSRSSIRILACARSSYVHVSTNDARHKRRRSADEPHQPSASPSAFPERSEEHTSELQSHSDLV